MSSELINGYDVWNMYTTIKLHFSSDKFDAFKYRFKSHACKSDKFDAWKGRYTANAISHEYQFKDRALLALSSVLVRNEKAWITEILDQKSKPLYTRARSYYNSSSLVLRELESVVKSDNFIPSLKSGMMAQDLFFTESKMSLELACYLFLCVPELKAGMLSHSDSSLIREQLEFKLRKLSPFCTLNTDEERVFIRKTLLNHLKTTE